MRIMKRIAIVGLAAACCAGLFAQTGTITLVSPNSGVNLISGQKAHIHWTYSGYPDNTLVRVVLWQNGVKTGAIATNVPIHSGQYTAGHGGYMWTVGSFDGGVASGCGFTINVRVQGETGDASISSTPFCIVASGQGSIRVEVPNGGESWLLGGSKEIRWASTGLTGNVHLRLRGAGGAMDRTIATNVPIAAGTFTWKVGDLLDPHPDLTEPTSGLKVVVQTPNGSFSDESDGTFKVEKIILSAIQLQNVQAQKWIKIHKPLAGAVFTRTKDCDVAWTFSDALKGKKAKLLLMKKSGAQQMVIEPSLPLNIDDYHWNIPGIDHLPAGEYSLRLQSLDFPEAVGNSGLFRIQEYAHQLDIKYSFTPVITNKGRYHSHRDSKDVFMMSPEGLEFADPGGSCCRLGWTNRCEDEWRVHWIYRSHLALDLSKIAATATVLNARLSWTENGSNPTAILLYKLTAPWDGDATSLFSVPCVAVNPNDAGQMRAAIQDWVAHPAKNYGLVFVGADESMNCGHAKTSIHVLCNLKLEVDTRLAVVD